jgi:hypothetical protein
MRGLIWIIVILSILFYFYSKNVLTHAKKTLRRLKGIKNRLVFKNKEIVPYIDIIEKHSSFLTEPTFADICFLEDCIVLIPFSYINILDKHFPTVHVLTKKDFLKANQLPSELDLNAFNSVTEITDISILDNGDITIEGYSVDKGLLFKNQYLATERVKYKLALDQSKEIIENSLRGRGWTLKNWC